MSTKLAFLFAFSYVIFFCLINIYNKNKISIKIIKYAKIVYLGYNDKTISGIIFGLIWAFFDGFITGLVLNFILTIFR
ncbi:hypothetical protein OWM07_01785 [Deferribacter thermophilus]|uniref:hypothetical protein n=1 Tax=Deferribacter thermophilus TaxID=53573 RepID=UPI003C1F2611